MNRKATFEFEAKTDGLDGPIGSSISRLSALGVQSQKTGSVLASSISSGISQAAAKLSILAATATASGNQLGASIEKGASRSVNELKRLGASFTASSGQAQHFGVVVTQSGGKVVNSLERAQGSLVRLQQQIQNTSFQGLAIPPGVLAQYQALSQRISGAMASTNMPAPALGPFAALNQKLAETKSRMQDLLASGKAVPAALTSSFQSLEKQVGAINRQFSQAPRALNSIGNSVAGLVGGFVSVGAAIAAVKTGLGIISDFQRIDASLRAVSSSSSDYAQAQNFLRSTSDSLGISYEALATSYKGLKAASNGTTLEGRETERIFLAVAHAGASLKLSNDEVKGSLLAIQQMMSKGTVQAEELRGQLGERLPGAFNIMARAMGVSTAELGKMLESGQVMAADVLPKLATELERTFGASAQSNVNTMAGGFTRATDQLKFFLAEFSNTHGIDTFFSKMGNNVANAVAGMREAQREGVSIFNMGRRPEMINRSKLRQQFVSSNAVDRSGMLQNLQLKADDYKNKITNPQDFGFKGADIKVHQRLLKETEEQILILKREGLKLAVAERIEADKTAATRLKAIATPAFDIDKAKDKQSVLAKQIANATINGGPVKALQAEYDKLTAQIDKATASTKKHTSTSVGNTLGLTTNAEILRRLTKDLQQNGDREIKLPGLEPTTLRERVALFQELVKSEKALTDNKSVDLGDKLKAIDKKPVERLTEALRDQVSPLEKVQGLLARFGEVGQFRSIATFQKLIEDIRFQAATLSLSNLALPQSSIDRLKEYTKELAKADIAARKLESHSNVARGEAERDDIQSSSANGQGWINFGEVFSADGWKDAALENLAKNRALVIGSAKEMTVAVQTVLRQGAVGAAESMGNFIGGLIAGTTNISDLPKIILGTVADMLQSLAQALAASAAVMLFVPGLQGQAIAQLAGATGLFAVAALARSFAQPKKAVAMANGATSYGPTYALTGEYPGASRDPEFTAPASKGAGLIAQHLGEMGLFGGGGGTLSTRVSGADLEFVLERTKRSKKTYGNG